MLQRGNAVIDASASWRLMALAFHAALVSRDAFPRWSMGTIKHDHHFGL
jgi:hypothetical protein